MNLLLAADPSRALIERYLASGTCFVASKEHEMVGVMVLDIIDAHTLEIKNISVEDSHQRQGIGTALLSHAEQECQRMGCNTLLIATGNSSIGQLALYQKCGFEMVRIERNFFLERYETPIFEDGIPCKHQVVLEKRIGEKNR
ncbi:GNAT family N-acetyltransferase [Pontibacter sp. G13]|uniref:GNAT family N-acetyltransferase n=1 Tax=Pontibacter sp. G13 TaxID=3074898 RepID=UPI002889C71C|nr:GNAT family N-acetyltransferase [Pontibacter sp. G13]WNJ17334.1 GNAT family N-acetyltransferase [Pontibacter sp. G13]